MLVDVPDQRGSRQVQDGITAGERYAANDLTVAVHRGLTSARETVTAIASGWAGMRSSYPPRAIMSKRCCRLLILPLLRPV